MSTFIEILNEMKSRTDDDIKNEIPSDGTSVWISKEIFVWGTRKYTNRPLVVTISPYVSGDKFDIHNDTYRYLPRMSNSTKENIYFPRISTEEQYFQQSLLHDLTDIPYEMLLEMNMLYDRVSRLYQEVQK